MPAPLDIDPAHSAGTGASRPRVTVAADGSAVVVWGEALPDGRTHVFARRIYDTTLSVLPQDATLQAFEGGAGGAADSPEVDVEFDRSYAWVAFRQTIGGQLAHASPGACARRPSRRRSRSIAASPARSRTCR